MAPRTQSSASALAAGLRLTSRAAVAAVLGLALWAAPASALQLAPDSPHSPNTDDMAFSYWVMLALVVAIAVVVNLALIVAIVRFRARRGQAPARVTAGRTVIPTVAAGLGVLAAAVFVFGVIMSVSARTVDTESGPGGLSAGAARTAQVPIRGVSTDDLLAAQQETLSQEPAGGDTGAFIPEEGSPLLISAIGQQWIWRFEYPGGVPGQRTFSYGELVVPVDTPVVLTLDSIDVIHSFWVPALTGQVQAVPGSLSETWFKADETGVYEGRATIFNGTNFPSMTAKIRVVEAAEYQAHVEGLAADLAEAQAAVAGQSTPDLEAEVEAGGIDEAEAETPGAEGEGAVE